MRAVTLIREVQAHVRGGAGGGAERAVGPRRGRQPWVRVGEFRAGQVK
jgi:hypothetical protein